MYIILDILFWIKEVIPVIALFVSIVAICLAMKSRSILKMFKEHVEVFFEKERMLRGYDYAVELFKQFIKKPEDIEILEKDISKYQLNIKQIFSDESKYQIQVYNSDWADIQRCLEYEEYTIEIIKEKNRKTMPKIRYLNKSKRGQYGVVVNN